MDLISKPNVQGDPARSPVERDGGGPKRPSKLVRWSGFATMLGGVLWTGMLLSSIPDALQEALGSYKDLYFIPLLLFLVGLIGLHARLRTGPPGRVRKAGLILAYLGLALASVCNMAYLLLLDSDVGNVVAYLSYMMATVVLTVGMLLLGVAVMKTKVLPRWNDAPLIIGSLGVLWTLLLPLTFLGIYWSTITLSWATDLGLAVRALFSIGWVLLGYALWSYKGEESVPAVAGEEPRDLVLFLSIERRMERISTWLNSLAFLDILESLGKLAVLVAVLLFLFTWDDRDRQRHYEAWQTITSAEGQQGSGGRVEAIEELHADGQSLVGLPAEDAFLENLDLGGPDQSSADLSSAKLEGADLPGANLRNAILSRADLDKVVLGKDKEGENATLEGVNLQWADLRESNLEGANLRGADLSRANIDESSLVGADLSPTEDGQPADLETAILEETNLRDANLTGANLYGAKLQNATLSGADLRGADLTIAELYNADLRDGTDLSAVEPGSLTQDQINVAKGDDTTLLPEGLDRPKEWIQEYITVPEPKEALSTEEEYYTEEFVYPFSFSVVGDGWTVGMAESLYALEIGNASGRLNIFNVREVYDSANPTLDNVVPVPEDIVDWFQDHPYLETGEASPVSVGGMSGMQFDVFAAAVPSDYPVNCSRPCVPFFPRDSANPYGFEKNVSHRIIVMDQGTETIVVDATATPDFLTEAAKVLNNVSWDPELESLSAREYRTEEFLPPLSVAVGKGWSGVIEDPNQLVLSLATKDGDANLSFLNPQRVYNPEEPSVNNDEDAPETLEDMVQWFQDHPYLDTEDPVPEKVGGASGVRFDASVSTVPLDSPPGCFRPCVPVVHFGKDRYGFPNAFYLFEGYETEVIVLDVEGEAVTITIESPKEQSDEFRSKAEELLDTVEWET